MPTKQSECGGRVEAPVDVVWKLFAITGQIGLYLFYRRLAEPESWGYIIPPKKTVAPQAAES